MQGAKPEASLNFFQRRRVRKQAGEILHHAGHVRHMREDIADPRDLAALDERCKTVRLYLQTESWDHVSDACHDLIEAIHRVAPPRPQAGIRENLEILVVAVAIAMAVRTYFIQPFKIPTGSMQPTLYGIHYVPAEEPGIMDRMPLKLVKVALFGQWYKEFRANADGPIHGPYYEQGNNSELIYEIGGLAHRLPADPDVKLRVRLGDLVRRGQVLASATRIIGDHIFVDKVRWNLWRPKRGQVMVFRTDDVPQIGSLKTHYIKRMVGLPGEAIGIHPPRLQIDGHDIDEPWTIQRIQQKKPGYFGYTLADRPEARLNSPNRVILLLKGEYLPMGDNTRSSFDGRYWGPVPQANLVGPAFLVYWPISSRWGIIH